MISNGDPNTARVVTLGINPSNRAFKYRQLRQLTDFGVGSPEMLSEDQAREVVTACHEYFSAGASHHGWFKRMDDFALQPLGVSYFDGTACHLNLTAWATDPVWSKLTPTVRAELLEADQPFLEEQLTQGPLDLILVNGAQALQTFEKRFSTLTTVHSIPRGVGGRSLVKVGAWSRATVIGWTLNLPHHGTSTAARMHLKTFLETWPNPRR